MAQGRQQGFPRKKFQLPARTAPPANGFVELNNILCGLKRFELKGTLDFPAIPIPYFLCLYDELKSLLFERNFPPRSVSSWQTMITVVSKVPFGLHSFLFFGERLLSCKAVDCKTLYNEWFYYSRELEKIRFLMLR